MEIIDSAADAGADLVQVAYTDTREEAALVRGLLREEGIKSLAKQGAINGPSLGAGLLTSSPRRIYVRSEQAAAARKVIGETMVEDPLEAEIPEPANAEHLADATGHKPRNYSVLGAYARAWAIGLAILAVVALVFIVSR